MEKSRAIELLKLAVPIKALAQQEYSDFVEAVNMGMDALEQPTIQPERAEGEWSDGYRWQRCSLCKQTGKKSWNYCPNCGARMTASTK